MHIRVILELFNFIHDHLRYRKIENVMVDGNEFCRTLKYWFVCASKPQNQHLNWKSYSRELKSNFHSFRIFIIPNVIIRSAERIERGSYRYSGDAICTWSRCNVQSTWKSKRNTESPSSYLLKTIYMLVRAETYFSC